MPNVTQSFEFHGKASEFFKIWIVNIMLSIVTLGVYSAWAKVRTRRYFYGNTLVLNTPFDYLADPVKILKGRLLAFAIILLYSFSGLLSPLVQGGLLLLFVPLLPWIIVKALQFNCYNSAYRNIRFHFRGEYLSALWTFIGLPILVAFTFGLAYPYFAKERKKFVIANTDYGTAHFAMSATAGQFYRIYVKTTVVALLILLLAAGLNYVLTLLLPVRDHPTMMVLPMLSALLFIPFFMIVYGYIYTAMANLVFNHTRLQHIRLESSLQPAAMCWLYFSNTLAIIFSLGLLVPWAMVRTARYRVSRLSMVSDGDLNEFLAAEEEKAGAMGEELGDLLDIDIGL
ncbi:YjgN family protein [Methylomarinum vadi]|uniref:YjgN family protein n=1 Tax=Methylomarinum vadi TaxID=438855 RepID=UPI00056395C3|nr:YjgN family protein [Methylomarinum vadi]